MSAPEPAATPSLVPSQSRWLTWVGRMLSALIIFPFGMSAFFKFNPPPEIVENFVKMGFTAEQMRMIGVVEVACLVVYLIPQTAVLGAILLTGYLGGATEVHVHQKESFAPPVIIGVIVWLGIFLRDPRVRALIPFRKL